MQFRPVAVPGRWSASAAICTWPLACLAMVLTLLSSWSTVAAAEKHRELEAAAPALGVTLHSLEVRGPDEFEGAFRAMTQERPDALFVVAEVLTLTHRCRILDFAAKNRLPTMSEFGVFAREGGLMAYGPQLTDTFQRGAYHVDRILKGAKPADLPVEQPMNFELVINLKTAEALGLTIPPHLLVLADRAETDRDHRCGRIW